MSKKIYNFVTSAKQRRPFLYNFTNPAPYRSFRAGVDRSGNLQRLPRRCAPRNDAKSLPVQGRLSSHIR